jgi:hypothetical protein
VTAPAPVKRLQAAERPEGDSGEAEAVAAVHELVEAEEPYSLRMARVGAELRGSAPQEPLR